MTKKNFLKSVLTTSALAATLLSAESAMAASAHDLPPGVATTAAAVLAGGGGANPGNWANTNGVGASLTIGADALVGGMIVGHTGVTIATTGGGGSIGSIASAANDAAKKATLTVGHNLTLVGGGNAAVTGADGLALANTYSGLGPTSITGGATLTLNMGAGAAIFTNTFDGAGTLTNSDDGTVFRTNIGNGTTLGVLNVNGNATIGGVGSTVTVSKITQTNIANAKTLTIDSTANAITHTGLIDAANANNGTLVLTGANTITIAGAVGNNAALSAVTTGAGAVSFSDVVKATRVTTNAGAVTFTKSITGALDLANAASQVTFGNGAGVTGAIDNTSGVADKGTVITGATDIAIGGAIGNTNSIAELRTAAGKVTLGAAASAKKIVIGAGGIKTGSNVTVGSDGISGTGQLTYTGASSLTFNPGADATVVASGMVVNTAAGANALNITAGTAFKSTFAGQVVRGDALSTVTFNGSVANSSIIFTNANALGTEAAPFANITMIGNNDVVELKGAKAYATVFELRNANAAAGVYTSSLRLGAGSAIVGTITPTTAVNAGQIIVLGDTGGKTTKINTGGQVLGVLKFDATADKDSKFTYLGQNNAVTINKVYFNAVNTGDLSGIQVDINEAGANANQNNELVLNNADVNVAGAIGSIKFINNTNNAKVKITTAGHIGTDNTKYLAEIDADKAPLTLFSAGAGTIHTNALRAGEVHLNAIGLGVYSLDADAATTYFLDGDSTILTKSKISSKDKTITLKFPGNDELALGDEVDFFGAVTQTTGAANAGSLTLNGTHTVSISGFGENGKAMTALNISPVAAGKVITLRGSGTTPADFYSPINFTANKATTLNVSNVNLKDSILNTSGNALVGTVNLQDNVKVSGSIGATLAANVKEVQVNTTDEIVIGADKAASAYNAGATTFQKDGTLNFNSNVGAGANFTLGDVTTNTDNTGTLKFNQAFATGGAIGADKFKLKEVQSVNGAALSVGHNLFVTNVTTDTTHKGTVTFTAASASGSTNVGSADKRFATVAANAGVTTLQDVYADAINVGAGATLAARRLDATNATGVALLAGSTAQVLDGGYVGRITSAAAGIVNVDGTATLAGDIGSAANIVALNLNGGDDKTVTFSGSTINANLVQKAAKLVVEKDTTVTGTSSFAGSTLGVGANKLTLTGAATFTGNTTIEIVPSASGIIVAPAGASLGAATDTLKLVRLAGGDLPDAGSETAVFVDAAGATQVLANGTATNVTITSTAFRSGEWNPTTSKIKWIGDASADKIVSSATLKGNENVAGIAKMIADAANKSGADTSMKKLLSLIEQVAEQGLEKSTDLVVRLSDRSDLGVTTMGCGMQAAQAAQAMGGQFAGQRLALVASAPQGVAAGDVAEKFGVWGQVTAGSADQKLRKAVAGFKARNFGAVVGVDTMLNDSSSFGIMVGDSTSSMKFKDAKAGDKLKANTWLFGAYGGYDFSNNFFMQANAAVATTSARAKNLRVTNAANKVTATGKYDVMSYALEVRGGYKYQFENSSVIPTVGLRYNYFGDTSYTETGAGAQNLKINGNSTSGISALAGVKLGTSVDVNGTMLMPEVHMNVDYALNKSAPKSSYTLDGSSVKFNYKGAKPAKFGYNFGTSIMTQTDNIEYGVGYDANIADKYLGHQGSLKVRMSF